MLENSQNPEISEISEIPKITWKDHTKDPYRISWLIIGLLSVFSGTAYLIIEFPFIAAATFSFFLYVCSILFVISISPKFIRGALNPWQTVCYIIFLGVIVIITWQAYLFFSSSNL